MSRKITSTELAKNTSEILDRVVHRGEDFVVERRGKTVCRIVPAKRKHATGAELVEAIDDFAAREGPLGDDSVEAIRQARSGGRKLAPWRPPS